MGSDNFRVIVAMKNLSEAPINQRLVCKIQINDKSKVVAYPFNEQQQFGVSHLSMWSIFKFTFEYNSQYLGKIHVNLPELQDKEQLELQREFLFPLPNDPLKRELRGNFYIIILNKEAFDRKRYRKQQMQRSSHTNSPKKNNQLYSSYTQSLKSKEQQLNFAQRMKREKSNSPIKSSSFANVLSHFELPQPQQAAQLQQNAPRHQSSSHLQQGSSPPEPQTPPSRTRHEVYSSDSSEAVGGAIEGAVVGVQSAKASSSHSAARSTSRVHSITRGGSLQQQANRTEKQQLASTGGMLERGTWHKESEFENLRREFLKNEEEVIVLRRESERVRHELENAQVELDEGRAQCEFYRIELAKFRESYQRATEGVETRVSELARSLQRLEEQKAVLYSEKNAVETKLNEVQQLFKEAQQASEKKSLELDHLERKVRVAESCEYSAGMLRAQNESLRRESEELHRQRAKLEERIVSLLRNESIQETQNAYKEIQNQSLYGRGARELEELREELAEERERNIALQFDYEALRCELVALQQIQATNVRDDFERTYSATANVASQDNTTSNNNTRRRPLNLASQDDVPQRLTSSLIGTQKTTSSTQQISINAVRQLLHSYAQLKQAFVQQSIYCPAHQDSVDQLLAEFFLHAADDTDIREVRAIVQRLGRGQYRVGTRQVELVSEGGLLYAKTLVSGKAQFMNVKDYFKQYGVKELIAIEEVEKQLLDACHADGTEETFQQTAAPETARELHEYAKLRNSGLWGVTASQMKTESDVFAPNTLRSSKVLHTVGAEQH